MIVESLYKCVPCRPWCLGAVLPLCFSPCFSACPSLAIYLCFPLTAPLCLWPILGILSVIDGVIRFLLYMPLSIIFLLVSQITRSHGTWLAGLTTFREGCLLCCGACSICFLPCQLPCVFYVDPDREEPPDVTRVISCVGCINARRFYYLRWWPEIIGSSTVGHPRWAWLGKFLSSEYQFTLLGNEADILRRRLDDSTCPEVTKWGIFSSCGFSNLVDEPLFPWVNEDDDPRLMWEAQRRDSQDMWDARPR